MSKRFLDDFMFIDIYTFLNGVNITLLTRIKHFHNLDLVCLLNHGLEDLVLNIYKY